MSEKPSINILDNFLTTAKCLNDHASAADLINKVVDSPAVYSFGEILEVPLINSVILNFEINFEPIYCELYLYR